MKYLFYTFCFFLLSFSISNAQVYVDLNATGSNDGSSWENAFTNLQSALSINTSSEIWVGEGEYKPSLLDSAVYFKFEAGHQLYGSLPVGATSLTEASVVSNPTIINGDLSGDDDETDNFVNKSDNALHLIYIPGSLSNSTIVGFNFRNGAALLTTDNNESTFQTRGGAIYSFSNISVDNCNFENNVARSGGAIYLFGANEGEISNCTFDNNYVFSQAGGLMLAECVDVAVSDCKFTNNAVNRGALYTLESVNCTITSCEFSNNTTNEGDFGSAGYFNWQSLGIQMLDCVFENNISENAAAIYLDGRNLTSGNQLLIDGCSFINNTAANFGAGIYVFEAEAVITNSSFDGNSAGDAGAMYLDSSKVAISESFFVNNSSDDFGGAIYCFEGVYELEDITFSNNTAVNGSGAYFARASCIIENSTWSNNLANESADDTTPFGAGLYMSRTDYVLNNSSFNGNISAYSAGAIFNSNSTFEVNGTTFLSNLGTFGGAVVNYNSETNGTYNNCTFLSNRANTSGGGGTVGFLGNAQFTNCAFNDNSADFGGALYMQNDSSQMSVIGCDFQENTSANRGGAIGTGASTFLDVVGSFFSMNQSNSGGAISYAADSARSGYLKVEKSIFEDNLAFGQGGAFDLSNVNKADITSCLIHSNIAQGGAGGGIINNAFNGLNSALSLVNNTIADNESGTGAGIAHFQEDGSDGYISLQNNILINFLGLDYEVEEGEPTVVSMGGNLTAYSTLANIFNLSTDAIQVDPSFVNQTGSDYHLNNSSAVIDQGVSTGGHTTDLDGLPIQGEVDKGCYENQMSVSTQDLIDVQGIRIITNPVSTQLNFEIDNNYSGMFNVSLINAQGQRILSENYTKFLGSDQFSLDVSTLSSGNYFAIFKIGNGVRAEKIIVE